MKIPQSVRFNKDLLDELKTLSKITGMPKTVIIERALGEYIMKSMLPTPEK